MAKGFHFVKWHQRRIRKKYEKLGFTERFYHSEDATVRYWIGGTGKPLLLIHGFGADGMLTWEKQIKPVAAQFQVIVPDLCWFGESTANLSPNLLTQITVMAQLLDYLEVNEYDVVGISYGGFVGLGLGCLFPDQVQKLGIVCSPGNTYNHALLKDLSAKAGVEEVEDLFVPTTPQEILRLIDLAFWKKRRIPSFLLKQMQELYFSRHHAEQRALLYALKTMNPNSFRTSVLLQKDVHLIWGAGDAIFPVTEGQKLAHHLNAEIAIIPKAGHAVNVERRRQFNKEFLLFLFDR